MLNRDQIELIHREIDGANTPEESAACRSLMEENAEAREEEAAPRHVARLFDRVEERWVKPLRSGAEWGGARMPVSTGTLLGEPGGAAVQVSSGD